MKLIYILHDTKFNILSMKVLMSSWIGNSGSLLAGPLLMLSWTQTPVEFFAYRVSRNFPSLYKWWQWKRQWWQLPPPTPSHGYSWVVWGWAADPSQPINGVPGKFFFFFFLIYYLFIYFYVWLRWVFVSGRGLS